MTAECTSVANTERQNASFVRNETLIFKTPTKEPVSDHHPVVLDPDVELFKVRLENMTNRFKQESIAEILKVKRDLLLEQDKKISNQVESHKTELSVLCEEVE